MASKRTYSVKLSDGSRMSVQATSGPKALAEAKVVLEALGDTSRKAVSVVTSVPVRIR